MELGPELFDLLNKKQCVGNQLPVVYGQGGMSEVELNAVETAVEIQLPPDFRYLFANVRDKGGVLFPWQNFDKDLYNQKIEWVWDGIAFDIENNAEWMDNHWGPRPQNNDARLAIARRDFQSWPKLLPICAHRFLVAEPCLSGNPVLSIMQTDIICYGADLAHYLMNEFIAQNYERHVLARTVRTVPYWSEFLR